MHGPTRRVKIIKNSQNFMTLSSKIIMKKKPKPAIKKIKQKNKKRHKIRQKIVFRATPNFCFGHCLE